MKDDMNGIVRMYFQQVSSYSILHEQLCYKNFGKSDYEALSLYQFKHRTETETEIWYNLLQQNEQLDVFMALKDVAGKYLLIRENQPICRYDKLMQWRELTNYIGEDIPVCAFLAHRTELGEAVWEDFEWSTVIGHDNMQLNRMMQKGISDNHFHLFGSAPSFKLIWLKLMNYPLKNQYAKALRQIDEKKRMTRNKYMTTYQEDSLEQMCFQAALIRFALFYYIYMVKIGNDAAAEKVVSEMEHIQAILKGNIPLPLYAGELQQKIDSMSIMNKMMQRDIADDYACLGYSAGSINHEFEGERALMYQMFLGRVKNITIPDRMRNWFYAYLVIQIKFREELVQVNENIGFENFAQYNKRKSKFLYTQSDDRKMVQHAVIGSLEPGNIVSLELRISPVSTVKGNRVWIEKCNSYLKKYLTEQQLENIYYVFHFPKKQDEKLSKKEGFVNECRHYSFRKKLEETADKLILFREQCAETAFKVKGIDACAQEIGCRPEVFGHVFRRLTQHVVKNSYAEKKVLQWKMTYHVGEDWIDFVDGLRAVDEAILFLNMRNGDRLGHATVLGLNVKKWYETKKGNICLPMQDYLDNIVWLYHKILEFDIRKSETLKGILCSEYEKYFRILYKPYIRWVKRQYSIDIYYEAWKLRGDNPRLYWNRKLDTSYHFDGEYWLNKEILGGKEIRENEEVTELLFCYHYSADVREKGREIVSANIISDIYIDGVKKVQAAMQKYVAERGICIEANPSSNYMISTMEEYGEHPIVNMFNLGLTVDKEELQKCAQLHVSINTDDKGIFYTSLENEFALMGCALENMKDSEGKKRYQKQMVYLWLEYIRQHGNDQSFLEHTRLV